MSSIPWSVVLFGSGETSSNGRRFFEWALSRLEPPVRMALLETPAGFELNSDRVVGRIADFVQDRLQNHRPQLDVIPARRRGTLLSPDEPSILEPMLRANAIFLGPGSPTYAVRQLKGSLAWQYLQARHRMGAALLLSSAATIAASARALPVYEIYKVGEDPHWREGLDLFAPFGLSLVFVPHWDNAEGGEELDTSRCFMGRERFASLAAMLPDEMSVVGIDEHTALAFDLQARVCHVLGRGGVSIVCQGEERRFTARERFSISCLGSYHLPKSEPALEVAQALSLAASSAELPVAAGPPSVVARLAEAREEARQRGDWPSADALRQQIADLGWQVIDTRDGPVLSDAEKSSA